MKWRSQNVEDTTRLHTIVDELNSEPIAVTGDDLWEAMHMIRKRFSLDPDGCAPVAFQLLWLADSQDVLASFLADS